MSDSAHKFISTYFQKIIDECRDKKLEPIKSKCQQALRMLMKIIDTIPTHIIEILKDLNQKQTSNKTLFPYVNEINIKLPESKAEVKEYVCCLYFNLIF